MSKINLKGKHLLFVAEKPSLMRSIQLAYKSKKRDYSAEFISLRGYLVGLKMPDDYKSEWGNPWKKEQLPMIPDKWEFKPGYGNNKDVKVIVSKMKNKSYDYIVNACDAGREGQSIFQSIYDYGKCKTPCLRLWASDTTNQTLSKALDNLLDAKSKDLLNMSYAAYLRMRFDWLIGMNLSRSITLNSGKFIPIGRVMTPTLKMVVDRDLEIENFVSKKYFELNALLKSKQNLEANLLNKDNKIANFNKKEDLSKLIKTFSNTLEVKSNTGKKREVLADKLFNLSLLQKTANKNFGYTAQEVLNICQSLYEKHKLLTYPRTSSTALSTAIANDIDDHIRSSLNLIKVKLEKEDIEKAKKNKKYFDNKKITDHHAIIPTKFPLVIQNLTNKEKNIYELVVKRFLAIFMKPEIIQDRTVILEEIKTKNNFRLNSSQTISLGFQEIYGKKIINANDLSKIKVGLKIEVSKYKEVEKNTNPPGYFTDATLIDAMVKARGNKDNPDEDELKGGLGTEATRAGIIEKLLKKPKNGKTDAFLKRDKKTIKSTPYGREVVTKIIKDNKIGQAKLTAEWEKLLGDVENGTLSPGEFNNKMITYIKNNIY